MQFIVLGHGRNRRKYIVKKDSFGHMDTNSTDIAIDTWSMYLFILICSYSMCIVGSMRGHCVIYSE